MRTSWFSFGLGGKSKADAAKEEAARLTREADIRRLYEAGTQREVLEQLYKKEEVDKCIENIDNERKLLALLEEENEDEQSAEEEAAEPKEDAKEKTAEKEEEDVSKQIGIDKLSFHSAKEHLGGSSTALPDNLQHSTKFTLRFDNGNEDDEDEDNGRTNVEPNTLSASSHHMRHVMDISLEDVTETEGLDSVCMSEMEQSELEQNETDHKTGNILEQPSFEQQESEDDLLKELLNTEGEESSSNFDSVTTPEQIAGSQPDEEDDDNAGITTEASSSDINPPTQPDENVTSTMVTIDTSAVQESELIIGSSDHQGGFRRISVASELGVSGLGISGYQSSAWLEDSNRLATEEEEDEEEEDASESQEQPDESGKDHDVSSEAEKSGTVDVEDHSEEGGTVDVVDLAREGGDGPAEKVDTSAAVEQDDESGKGENSDREENEASNATINLEETEKQRQDETLGSTNQGNEAPLDNAGDSQEEGISTTNTADNKDDSGYDSTAQETQGDEPVDLDSTEETNIKADTEDSPHKQVDETETDESVPEASASPDLDAKGEGSVEVDDQNKEEAEPQSGQDATVEPSSPVVMTESTDDKDEMDAEAEREEMVAMSEEDDDAVMDEREHMETTSVEDDEELLEQSSKPQERADEEMNEEPEPQAPEAMDSAEEIEEVQMNEAKGDDGAPDPRDSNISKDTSSVGSGSESSEESPPPPPPPPLAETETDIVEEIVEIVQETANRSEVFEEVVILEDQSGRVVCEEVIEVEDGNNEVVEELVVEDDEEIIEDDAVEEVVIEDQDEEELVEEEVEAEESSESEYADQVVESWNEVIEEQPEDLEAAVSALIAVVYKDEDVDVESMLRRTRLPELYKYLKSQYWYKIHTNEEEEARLAAKIKYEKPTQLVSVDDMLKGRMESLIANVQQMDQSERRSSVIPDDKNADESVRRESRMQNLIDTVQISSRNLVANERKVTGNGNNMLGSNNEEDEEEDLFAPAPSAYIDVNIIHKLSSETRDAGGGHHVAKYYEKAVNNRAQRYVPKSKPDGQGSSSPTPDSEDPVKESSNDGCDEGAQAKQTEYHVQVQPDETSGESGPLVAAATEPNNLAEGTNTQGEATLATPDSDESESEKVVDVIGGQEAAVASNDTEVSLEKEKHNDVEGQQNNDVVEEVVEEAAVEDLEEEEEVLEEVFEMAEGNNELVEDVVVEEHDDVEVVEDDAVDEVVVEDQDEEELVEEVVDDQDEEVFDDQDEEVIEDDEIEEEVIEEDAIAEVAPASFAVQSEEEEVIESDDDLEEVIDDDLEDEFVETDDLEDEFVETDDGEEEWIDTDDGDGEMDEDFIEDQVMDSSC
ncbi:expressed unknown protein [Seminavis robusta]|uniref:Uncharacterized protein n=1 Tax=Seminavis robusta TaxID=568900 RepID=A0A9N8D693_9STRA|nr:expressed unknown protein [Seminavis robusta]|eukprot:Sro15_g011210.1 n/a (1340) ;mRNA; r:98459-102563